MKNRVLEITEESITLDDNTLVMHRWETPIMQKKAQWVCSGGGDIIEFGFGMGISADYIQQHKINSHTICEIHPQVLEKLYEWAKTKDNVIILEGDWYDNRSKMEKYDGILFDTHSDKKTTYFFTDFIYKIARERAKLTWWNNFPHPYNTRKPPGTVYEKMEVNPPPNNYFNSKEYYLPKFEFSSR